MKKPKTTIRRGVATIPCLISEDLLGSTPLNIEEKWHELSNDIEEKMSLLRGAHSPLFKQLVLVFDGIMTTVTWKAVDKEVARLSVSHIKAEGDK